MTLMNLSKILRNTWNEIHFRCAHFFWFITDAPSLSSNAKKLIENINNERLLSIASIWEIAIKVSLGKLELAKPFEEFIAQQLKQNFIELLPIKMPQLAKVIKLPFHHRDPFDRLIISQSLTEPF